MKKGGRMIELKVFVFEGRLNSYPPDSPIPPHSRGTAPVDEGRFQADISNWPIS